MKKTLLVLIVCLSITSVGLSRVQGYVPPKEPVDEVSGNFEGKIIWSHNDENGNMTSYNVTVHGYTLSGCQNEMNLFSNIQIVTPCHQI